jgi:hypothetical protein
MRERDIEAHLVKRVKQLAGEVRKVEWVGRRGAPDRLVMLPNWDGQIIMVQGMQVPNQIWVELKAPGVEPEPYQLREHARMRALGQRVEVIDSIEAVESLLS